MANNPNKQGEDHKDPFLGALAPKRNAQVNTGMFVMQKGRQESQLTCRVPSSLPSPEKMRAVLSALAVTSCAEAGL